MENGAATEDTWQSCSMGGKEETWSPIYDGADVVSVSVCKRQRTFGSLPRPHTRAGNIFSALNHRCRYRSKRAPVCRHRPHKQTFCKLREKVFDYRFRRTYKIRG